TNRIWSQAKRRRLENLTSHDLSPSVATVLSIDPAKGTQRQSSWLVIVGSWPRVAEFRVATNRQLSGAKRPSRGSCREGDTLPGADVGLATIRRSPFPGSGLGD